MAFRKCNCNRLSCFTCHRRYILQRHRFKYGKALEPPQPLRTLDPLDLAASRKFREKGWEMSK